MRSAWRRTLVRVRGLDRSHADALLAGVFLTEASVEVALLGLPADRLALGLAAIVLQAAGILVRRRHPLLMVLAAYGGLSVLELLSAQVSDVIVGPALAVVLAAYSAGAYATDRRFRWMPPVTFAACATAITVDQTGGAADDYLYGGLLLVMAPLLLGRIMHNRAGLNRALEEKTRRLEHERAQRAAEAVAGERARIAGELHDVVAHALSAMVVQAGAARRSVGPAPEQARSAFASVELTGREALMEIRRLLGVLRREDEELALAPQPSLGHVGALVQRMRRAGLPVDLHVEGEAPALPAGVDLTAYRVIQEALAEALEHGGAGRAEVTVRYGVDEVRVEVLDDGRTGDEPRALLGMRERVALYGGDLEAASRLRGGHAIRARLPLGGAA
jgi:signal transduction histidine kinase